MADLDLKRNCNCYKAGKLSFMLDVHKLRVLREVATHGSFSSAALALHFSPSAVSQHIAALEEQAGTQLVIRGARGIRLTDAGQLLVRHADAVLRRLDDAEAELGAMMSLRGGRLRLAAFTSAGATLLPATIAAFKRAYPEVEVSCQVEADAGPALDALRRGDADLALVLNYNVVEIVDPTEVVLTEILVEPMRAVVPATHRLAASAQPIELAELAEEHWIQCYSAACGLVLERGARLAGFTPSVTFQTDDYQTTLAFVGAGLGVALLPAIALLNLAPDVSALPIASPELRRHIAAATPSDRERPPAVDAILTILQRTASSYAVEFERELRAVLA